jgi:hypothetical protein
VLGSARAAGTVALIVALYYLLPFTHLSTGAAAAVLVVGLAVLVALVVAQVRAITVAPLPAVRAVEALATSVPLFLLLFAGTYETLAARSAASFGGPLTHTDALYFTVTVFATVGFGDITAKSETARLVVTGQMVADLVVIGIAVKAIVGAARRAPTGSR